jgi:putative transposase
MTGKRRKRHGPEQIVRKLRDADAMLNAGKDVAEVLQALEVSDETRSQYTPCHSLALIWRGLLLVLIN